MHTQSQCTEVPSPEQDTWSPAGRLVGARGKLCHPCVISKLLDRLPGQGRNPPVQWQEVDWGRALLPIRVLPCAWPAERDLAAV